MLTGIRTEEGELQCGCLHRSKGRILDVYDDDDDTRKIPHLELSGCYLPKHQGICFLRVSASLFENDLNKEVIV